MFFGSYSIVSLLHGDDPIEEERGRGGEGEREHLVSKCALQFKCLLIVLPSEEYLETKAAANFSIVQPQKKQIPSLQAINA